MKEYIKAQSKTNEIIVGNTVNADELDRFSKSDFRWADNRKNSFQHRPVKREKSINLNSERILFLKCLMSTVDL